ncbi:MAG: heparan-alpha-glucosaminide N-acetyltransferase domain-containing protein [Candidatus Micrarchaeota archaeon]
MRISGIDLFRGLSILLMVFFTMVQIFSGSLPDILVHNKPHSLHLGDFVLPMFLFASGMSLVFFQKKRSAKGKLGYSLDVFERAGKLTLIWIFLSPISSGAFLGLDELMLSVILSVVCLAVVAMDWRLVAGLAFLPVIGYLGLYASGALPDFSGALSGGFGYWVLPFYLPVMLAGVLAGRSLHNGRWSVRTTMLFWACSILTLALVFLVQPWKLDASPSFMGLSVMLSLVVFILVGERRNGLLEYLGRKPLRYWVLMFVLVLIPLSAYVLASGEIVEMGPLEAIAASLACCVIVYLGSRLMDVALSLLPEAELASQAKGR